MKYVNMWATQKWNFCEFFNNYKCMYCSPLSELWIHFLCSSLKVWQIFESYFYMSSTFPLLIMFKPFAEENMTTQVLSIMEKYEEPSSNIMKVANLTFSGDDGKTNSTNMMGLNLKEALSQHDKCMVRNLVLNGCIKFLNAICTFDTCQCRSLMRSAVIAIGWPLDTQ